MKRASSPMMTVLLSAMAGWAYMMPQQQRALSAGAIGAGAGAALGAVVGGNPAAGAAIGGAVGAAAGALWEDLQRGF